MLPAVAVRKLVPRNARIINPYDEAPRRSAVSAAAMTLPRGGSLLPTASSAESPRVACQHRLDPIHPPHEQRWGFQVLFTREPAAPRRDMKIRRPHARPRRH